MIEINHNPSKKELAWFGVLCLAFFGIIGLSVLRKTHSMHAAVVLWIIGTALVSIYYLLPPLRKPIYLGWMYAAFPIGWVVSHVLLAAAFFLVFTPVGLLMRLLGRDPMARQFDPAASTYWVAHDPGTRSDRYFRQS